MPSLAKMLRFFRILNSNPFLCSLHPPSISVDILDYPHLSPCYFDLTSQFNRAAATNFDNFGKVGKLEVVEEIAKKVSEFYG